MRELLYFDTRVGRFLIVQSDDGMYHPFFKGFSLGRYALPHEAVLNLSAGRVLSFPGNIDTATLGIPADLERWRYVRPSPMLAGLAKAAVLCVGLLLAESLRHGVA